MTSVGCSRANEISQHVRTRHVRHIFMPDDQTNQNYSSHTNNLLNVTIQSHLCCNQTKLIGLLQQSIPFCVDLVYILVHFPKFSFINFVALNAEKSSSLHTIIEQANTNQASIYLDFYFVYFSFH